ncbi:MAG: PilX N-terminal domain-containing pilus assembly protein [Solimonas sp.]
MPALQRGVALVVALVLLILITLIGLAAIYGTLTQTKMTSNFYDRSVAFQNAEAGLAAGAAVLSAGTTNIRDCTTSGDACKANPFDDLDSDSRYIQTVDSSTFEADAAASGQPQFVIENMGDYEDASSSTGYGQSANSAQYGASGTTYTYTYYRITARSGDPTTVGERAVVTLQAMYKE